MIEDIGLYYRHQFICDQSALTRAELESLMPPYNTFSVDDDTMQKIVDTTDYSTKKVLGLLDGGRIDFTNPQHITCWWDSLKKCCTDLNIPLYEI